MKILVTGGAGFIGSAFCRRIFGQFHYLTLVNIDNLYPCSTASPDLIKDHDNYYFIKANINDTALLLSTLKVHNIDTIVHFAAQSHVDTSFTNPMLYTQDNTLGTHSLLEAARQYGKIKRFIHISTDEVYGENTSSDPGVKTETSLLKPTNPYAASKAGAEMLVHSYVHSYNLPAIVIRSNNIYGPGQYPEKVVPRFILQLLNNLPITIQGSGRQLRSFLFVEDAVDAVLCILFQGEVGEIYNISSKDEISICDLAMRLQMYISPEKPFEDCVTFVEDRNFNDKRYWIKSEPLSRLGWKQGTSLEDGLLKTVEWFKKNASSPSAPYWIATAPSLTSSSTAAAPNKISPSTSNPVIYFFGAKGWIGKQFTQILESRGWTVHKAKARADNSLQISKELSNLTPMPTHIVSMIGRTHGPGFSTIDYLEQPGKLVENLTDNLYAPLVLAEVARMNNLHFTYLGTGCIFEYDNYAHLLSQGEQGQGFTEQSAPNFFGSSYSVVKGFTDRLLGNHPNTLNVRIRMPISSQDGPRNFITKIIQYNRICSIPNSMTVLDDILPLLADALAAKTTGTLNATNPGLIDHTTILNWYKEIQNPKHTWEEVDNATLVKTLVKGARSNNFLDTNRITTLFPGRVPHILHSVRKILETYPFKGRAASSS
jgi:UDP-glucose 4,6-dehydratase